MELYLVFLIFLEKESNETMNIHEYQAKKILEEFGAPVTNGFVIFKPEEIQEKIKKLTTENVVLKAQIHAGGRGKAGGIKLVKKKRSRERKFKNVWKNFSNSPNWPKGKKS